MFTEGGQLDTMTFMGVRGGGGKGGGGGSSPPPQRKSYVDPVDGTVFTESPEEAFWGPQAGQKSTEERFNEYITNRKANEKTTSDAALKKTADDKATAHTKWLGTRDTAYNDALTNVKNTFTNAGLDPTGYMDQYINPALNTAKNSIIDDSPNPSSAFSSTLGETILGNVTSGKRTKAETDFNNIFKTDYTNTLLPDTGLDTYVNPLLDEQFTPLQQQLQNALGRGTLSQTGYDAALNSLGSKRTAAYGTVRDLGRSILNEDRGYINDIVGQGRSTIAGLKPNQAFDPLTFDTQAKNRAASEQGSFGGELRSKVGNSKFVDLSELLNAGGAAQGALAAPAATNVGGATGLTPAEEEAKKKRGLGNTGAF